MEKLNIAELLKDCPKGMELNCTMYENVEFDYIEQNSELVYPIHCLMKINGGYNALVFTCNGCNDRHPNAKCVIFPKGKTTWEGFHRPFKDGDILSYQYEDFTNRTIYIYMQHSRMNTTYYVALSGNFDSEFMINDKEEYALNGYNDSVRLATEEEKEKLFDAIKANGYKWNAETKTLEKLVEPKFKVGDRIQSKNFIEERTIKICEEDGYWTTVDSWIRISDQDNWGLVPNKFDINTLVPLESKVLVRNVGAWLPAFWGYYSKEYTYPFVVDGGNTFAQCIPYEGNEHLLGTANDCDNYYKNWE